VRTRYGALQRFVVSYLEQEFESGSECWTAAEAIAYEYFGGTPTDPQLRRMMRAIQTCSPADVEWTLDPRHGRPVAPHSSIASASQQRDVIRLVARALPDHGETEDAE
jgi:hypothetical protein